MCVVSALYLICRIFEWRQACALRLDMSPEAVLKTGVAMQVALLQVSSVAGLQTAGVRITGVQELAEVIADALVDLELVAPGEAEGQGGQGEAMQFSAGWTPGGPWEHAKLEAPGGGTGAKKKMRKAPYWEDSWQQHHEGGASLQSIALLKNLQPATILKHLLVGMTMGLAVDLAAVGQQARQQAGGGLDPPDSAEWAALEAAEEAAGLDVTGQARLEEGQWEALCGHIPEARGLAAVPYKNRPDADNQVRDMSELIPMCFPE